MLRRRDWQQAMRLTRNSAQRAVLNIYDMLKQVGDWVDPKSSTAC
jgi:hypothetical protein